MISWMIKLCALCSMSALTQMMMEKENARGVMKMICGMLMLHMTCESAQSIIGQMESGGGLTQMLEYLMK